MLSRNILIAIFVAAYFRNSSQRFGEYIQCNNDIDFKNAVEKAKKGIVIIIVTTQASYADNLKIKRHFENNKTIQVNLDQGYQGACRRTVELLEVNTGNNITLVRMMKNDVLVPYVLVVGFDPGALDAGFNKAFDMVTRRAKKHHKVSNRTSHWLDEQPMPGTGPEASQQGSPQPLPDTGPQSVPPRFPFATSEAIPPTYQFVMPSGTGAIPAGQWTGSSLPPGQRASYDLTYQQRSVHRAQDSSGLPRAPAGGSYTPSSGQQSGGTALGFEHQGNVVDRSWLTLAPPGSGSDVGSDEPTSEQPRSNTPWYLETNTSRDAGSSRGPR